MIKMGELATIMESTGSTRNEEDCMLARVTQTTEMMMYDSIVQMILLVQC